MNKRLYIRFVGSFDSFCASYFSYGCIFRY